MNAKACSIAYALSGIWLFLVYAWMSDYHWFRSLSIGTWGFLLVDAITLAPVILILLVADRFQPAGKSGNPR
ncbi:hypothetical protein [Cohnella cholangitidis]|uniref:DUF997 family protein n=1 Tax=Cohnella cholangitidis TaxID=2598458 RepID=A0A7G5BV46_9BACL|nr:hypothetical protein [Cohnella cholangitidis]QMV40830.1 hypothetical protein FPL14_06120 [Cohnella cholangitidis]